MPDSELTADELAVDGSLVVTRDAFFGGRLILNQPARGHRSGTDAVLLAAAVPRDVVGRVYDVGAGAGTAGLGVALFAPGAAVTLVERDPEMARLARENIAENGLGSRVDVAVRDLLMPGSGGGVSGAADLVLTNPPFHQAGRVRSSPVALRRAAHTLDPDVTLTDWLRACLDLLAPRGELIVIHAAAAVPEMLAALEKRAGGCVLKPIHPRSDAAAHRVLLRAKAGSRAPLAIAAPLILHDTGGGFTREADRLHRGDAALSW